MYIYFFVNKFILWYYNNFEIISIIILILLLKIYFQKFIFLKSKKNKIKKLFNFNWEGKQESLFVKH